MEDNGHASLDPATHYTPRELGSMLGHGEWVDGGASTLPRLTPFFDTTAHRDHALIIGKTRSGRNIHNRTHKHSGVPPHGERHKV